MLDSGSPVSFIKDRFIPGELKVDFFKNKYIELNQSKLNVLGKVKTKINLDYLSIDTIILIVPSTTMAVNAVIGRDLLNLCFNQTRK